VFFRKNGKETDFPGRFTGTRDVYSSSCGNELAASISLQVQPVHHPR